MESCYTPSSPFKPSLITPSSYYPSLSTTMNSSSQYSSIRPSPRRELQLQGPRPSPLKVSKDSHKIKKPPTAPPNPAAPPPHHRPPVIIYTVSPKIIHTSPRGFMSLVQRLTGPTSTDVPNIPSPTMSSPKRSATTGLEELDSLGVDHRPGILSPVPSSLPSIPPSFFSENSSNLGFFQDQSPGFNGSRSFVDSTFMVNPNSFLSSSTAVLSPGAYWDLFNQYQDL